MLCQLSIAKQNRPIAKLLTHRLSDSHLNLGPQKTKTKKKHRFRNFTGKLLYHEGTICSLNVEEESRGSSWNMGTWNVREGKELLTVGVAL